MVPFPVRISRRPAGARIGVRLGVLLGALVAWGAGWPGPAAAGPALTSAPEPAFDECPAVGAATGCSVLLTFAPDGTVSVDADGAQHPYDGSRGILVGVLNESGRTLTSFALDTHSDLGGGFDFDGSAPCQYVPAPPGCPTPGFGGATGSSGPGNTFSAISGDGTAGTVTFLGAGLPTGGTSWFGLARDLREADIAVVPSPVFAPGSGYHPVVPYRVLDSRDGTGFTGPVAAGTARSLVVGGVASVPSTAVAVVLGVTAVAADGTTYVRVWPTGWAEPVTSNLNVSGGRPVANLVTVRLGDDGMVSFATAAGSVQVVADVLGYYDDGTGAGDRYEAVTPTRLLDSRTGTGGWDGPLGADEARELVVAGTDPPGPVPAPATAVVANVTVTGADEPSFLTLWPAGSPRPATSNLPVAPGRARAVAAIVGVGTGGALSVANAHGHAHVLVDVVGYFDPGGAGRFHPVPPERYLDSRAAIGVDGPWTGGQSRSVTVTGRHHVATDATSVVSNLIATGASTETYVVVHPTGAPRPSTSNLNLGPGETLANQVTAAVGDEGGVSLVNDSGDVQLVGDVVGFYAPS